VGVRCSSGTTPVPAAFVGSESGDLWRVNPGHVLIADDHVIIRRGLRNLLQDRLGVRSIQEAGSLAELIRQLGEGSPDLLVLDLQLGDGHSLDVLERLRTEHPRMRVLVYTMSPEHIYGPRVLAMGGSGFLSKQASEEEVLRALRRVMQGREYRSHELELAGDGRGSGRVDPFQDLSDRELLVMNALLQGTAVKDIAERLELRPTTVATYKARLFDKLGVSNLLDLQRLAQLHGYHIS
jgi:two-component system invasion response regulator UvrY